MSKFFLDSNILIYLYTSDETGKTTAIKNLLEQNVDVFVSTQVLFEFSYVVHRKLKLGYGDIERALQEFSAAFEVKIITYNMIIRALQIASKYHYSFPDSLIITAALESECDILFSEDMHNAHIVENKLKIINPFKS